MKGRGFMSWWMKNHPLSSKRKTVRYVWLIATLPIQIVTFPSYALFKAVLEFSRSFGEVMRDWVDSMVVAWRKAGK